MSRISIPDQRLEPLLKLAKLPAKSIKELFTVLAGQPIHLYLPDAPESIAKELKTIKYEDGEKIVSTLLSLYPAFLSFNRPINLFVDDLVRAFSDQLSDSKDFDPSLPEKLSDALQKLLRVPSLSTGAKATNILYQIERSLLSSRVISDIRPIFDLESDEINGALVLHTLKLDYVADDPESPKEFFVTITPSDIDQLIFNLTKAKRKALKMQEILRSASITYIESEESDE